MIIYLKKFGTLLNGRVFGREAFAALLPSLNRMKDNERIEVDCGGVEVLTPAWADEFLTSLIDKFGDNVVLKNAENPAVKETLIFLEETNKIKFNRE